MTIGFQPSDDNVLVRLVPAGDAGEADGAAWADVLAVGPGRRTADGAFVAPDLNPGDRVALRPGRAVPLRVHDEALAVVGAADVLGVLSVARQEHPSAVAAAGERQEQPPEDKGQSLETNIAPDELDHEASTAEDLH